MKQYWVKRILIAFTIASSTSLPLAYCEPTAENTINRYVVSPNVSLNSYVYDYLEKLDGLGYLNAMPTGTKPYTRLQAATYIRQISINMDTSSAPQYARQMLRELTKDFNQELSTLTQNTQASKISLKEISLGEYYYSGDVLPNKHTKSYYQPLHINDNGNQYANHANEVMSLRYEGNLNNDFALSFTPQIIYNDTGTNYSTQSAYLKTHINNLSVQIGKESMWWGQGYRGSLLLTNNAAPQTSIKLANLEPMKFNGFLSFLGQTNTTFFYSVLESNRTDINYPSFTGIRADFTPTNNFTFAVAGTSMVGGQDHMLSSHDYLDFLTGTNADSSGSDNWNSIAGADFRWRLPKLNGLQIYGELYGEDQSHILEVIPFPSKTAELIGLYFPHLTSNGNWDLHLECARTSSSWYNHWTYTDGYTYKGNIMGDAMGNNAHRYYAKFTHFASNGTQFSVHLEHVSQQPDSSAPQNIDSIWLSTRRKIQNDMFLDASIGMSNIKNKNYESGNSAKNYLVSTNLTKQF